jgi:hypothetical protein
MSRSENRYKTWHQQPIRGSYEIDLDLETNEPWIELGKAQEITYWSDKWNRKDAALYTHKFAYQWPKLIAHPYQDALLIVGGKFTITERGLLR